MIAQSRYAPSEREKLVAAVSKTVDETVPLAIHDLHYRDALDLSGNEASVLAVAKDRCGVTAEIEASPESPVLVLSSAAGGSIKGPPEEMAVTLTFEMAIVQVTGSVRIVSNDVEGLTRYYVDLEELRSIYAGANFDRPIGWPRSLLMSIADQHVEFEAGDVSLNDRLEPRVPRLGNWAIEFEPGARMTLRRLRVVVGAIP